MPLAPEKRLQEVSSRGSQFRSMASTENNVDQAGSTKYLWIALVAVGLILIARLYPLTIVWPSGWSWHTGHSDYLQMILGLYPTLGVFSLDCQPQAARTLEPHLVHGMVEHRARGNHGRAVFGKL